MRAALFIPIGPIGLISLIALSTGACASGSPGAESSPVVEEARRLEEEIERVPLALTAAAEVPEWASEETPETALEPPAIRVDLAFAPGAATLDPDARATLDRLVERLSSDRSDREDFRLQLRCLTLEGNLEPGDLRLAERRLAAVRRYLHRNKGIPLERIAIFGLADTTRPAAVADERTVVVRMP